MLHPENNELKKSSQKIVHDLRIHFYTRYS